MRAYNIADILVFPSTMDNLPNIIKEATCCGIPCVGFNVGGMPDMISHKETGYLADAYDAQDLARGIAWTIERGSLEMMEKVRDGAQCKHNQASVVSNYFEYYEDCLESI